MAEILELYDRNKKPSGMLLERGKPVPEGYFHLIVNIMTINEHGEILVTQRHPSKKGGLKWETTGGAVAIGEESTAAAMRELFEETGIKKNESELNYIGTYIETEKIADFYITHSNFKLSELTLQDIEVVDAKWVSFSEYEEMLENGRFIHLIPRIYESFGDKIRETIKNVTEGKS